MPPKIYLYDDHLEIMSHGNPLDRMGKDEFLRGKSKPLNEALMKIAINVELTDQTGKGNKDIVRAYGPEAFEFSDTFLTVKLPYNPLAMDGNEGTGERDVPVNVPVNVPANADALSESETATLSALATNPNLVREQLAEMLGKSVKTVARVLDFLKKKGRIVRIGSDKNGHWEIAGGNNNGE